MISTNKQMKLLDNRTGERIYYLAQMPQQKFKKLRAKAYYKEIRPCRCGGRTHYHPGTEPGRFTKEVIERFPRHLRRGGEYGHEK